MANAAFNIEGEVVGTAVHTVVSDSPRSYTIADYLTGYVNFYVPDDAVKAICFKRNIEPDGLMGDFEERDIELAKADILLWICRGMSTRASIVDRDNSWSHQDGGFTMTPDDKKALRAEAKAIYEQYDEPFPLGTKVRIISEGIKHCNYSIDGTPLPHIVR